MCLRKEASNPKSFRAFRKLSKFKNKVTPSMFYNDKFKKLQLKNDLLKLKCQERSKGKFLEHCEKILNCATLPKTQEFDGPGIKAAASSVPYFLAASIQPATGKNLYFLNLN